MKITPVNTNIQNTSLQSRKINSSVQNPPAFKGSKEAAITNAVTKGGKDGLFVRAFKAVGLDELIARGTAKLSQTNFSKKAVDIARRFKSPSGRMCDLESFAVTFFYVQNTAKSKKIDEERKVPSMVQNVAVTVASSTAAALIDASINPLVDSIALAYDKLPESALKKLPQINPAKPHIRSTQEFYNAAKKLKSNSIFTLVVRFLVPVLMVPAVGKMVEKIKEHAGSGEKTQNNDNKTQQNPKSQQAPGEQPQQSTEAPSNTPSAPLNPSENNKFTSLFA